MKTKTFIYIAVFFVFEPLLGSLPAQAEWYSHQNKIFGTAFGLEFWVEDAKSADKAIKLVETEMWRLHHMLSPYEEESELSYINNNGFLNKIGISSEMSLLLSKALNYSQATNGAFDPSFSSLGRYYDYRLGKKPEDSKSAIQIQKLKEAIDYRGIDLDVDNLTIKLPSADMNLDLGGIAKGYAMDRAVDILDSLGVEHASVSAGGDMRILGDKRGRPWIIGIRNPRQDATAIRLPLENIAVSTSGDYERFFIDQESGGRVHHILNPETGKSARKLSSVTVLGKEGLDTDPLSTAVFVLGAEQGLTLINTMPEFDAVIIDTAGKVYFSQGLIAPE